MENGNLKREDIQTRALSIKIKQKNSQDQCHCLEENAEILKGDKKSVFYCSSPTKML